MCTMSKPLLVIDEEGTIRDVLERDSRREAFAVRAAADAESALQTVSTAQPDLIVLDLRLPQIDGWELCRRLRAETTIPILMLTARGEEYERILGLGLGADDYITKPFSPGEVVARIKAIFRRIDMARAVAPLREELIHARSIVIDPRTRQATVSGKQVSLT